MTDRLPPSPPPPEVRGALTPTPVSLAYYSLREYVTSHPTGQIPLGRHALFANALVQRLSQHPQEQQALSEELAFFTQLEQAGRSPNAKTTPGYHNARPAYKAEDPHYGLRSAWVSNLVEMDQARTTPTAKDIAVLDQYLTTEEREAMFERYPGVKDVYKRVRERSMPDLPAPSPEAPATPPLESPETSPPPAAPPESEVTRLSTQLAEETRLRMQAEEEIKRLQGQLTAAKAAGEKAEQETAALLRTQLKAGQEGEGGALAQARKELLTANSAKLLADEKVAAMEKQSAEKIAEARRQAREIGYVDGQRSARQEAATESKLADEAHQLALKSLQSDHAQQINALQAELSAAETKANTQTQETAVKLKAAEQRTREAESAREKAQGQAAAANEALTAANEALAREAQAITAQQAEMKRLEGNNAEQKMRIADLEAQLQMQRDREEDILQRLSEASEAQKGGITLDPAARQIIAEALAIENYPLDGLNPELAAFIAELRKSLEEIVKERAKKIASRTGQLKTKGPPKPDQEPASAPSPGAGEFEELEL